MVQNEVRFLLFKRDNYSGWVSDYVQLMMRNPNFFFGPLKMRVKVALLDAEQLGVVGWAAIDFFQEQGEKHLESQGFRPCFHGDVTGIRAEYQKQPLNEWIRVVTKPLIVRGVPSVFCIGNDPEFGKCITGRSLESHLLIKAGQLFAVQVLS